MIPVKVLEKIDMNREKNIAELLSFLSIPSISTYSGNTPDVLAAAAWVHEQLKDLGFETTTFETERHPVVCGSRRDAPDKPTLLIYGHYDVQPPEPLDEWLSPPFSPQIRDGYVYARGACDDKGQFFTYLKAIAAVLESGEKLPINIKFLVEGEEEIGSPNLEGFLEEHKTDFAADVIAVSDGSQFKKGVPAITYGLRGLCYLQVDIQGPGFDLHSGSFGGIVANPVQVLADIISKLKNPDGTVAVPGFYDDVLDLDSREREEMASLKLDEAELERYLGVSDLPGEPGYTPLERKSARPTLDVNGIWGGFSGEGAKTIIPARAGAKISMRLVPNQSHVIIDKAFKDYVKSLLPPGVTLKITKLNGADPVMVNIDNPEVQSAARAIKIGFGVSPVYIREGGSIPIIGLFNQVLGVESILMLGWGSPDDGAHSPNERFLLEDFHRGTRSAAALLFELAG